jgi:hypothetical protein
MSSALSGIGRANAIMGLIGAVIFNFISLPLGIHLLTRKNKYSKKVTATISIPGDIGPSPGPAEQDDFIGCELNISKNTKSGEVSKIFNCYLNIEYIVNGQTYYNDITISNSTEYKNGDTIDIFYNPDDPNDIQTQSFPTKPFGWGLIVVGIIIFILAFARYKLKALNTLSGGATVASVGAGVVGNLKKSFTKP